MPPVKPPPPPASSRLYSQLSLLSFNPSPPPLAGDHHSHRRLLFSPSPFSSFFLPPLSFTAASLAGRTTTKPAALLFSPFPSSSPFSLSFSLPSPPRGCTAATGEPAAAPPRCRRKSNSAASMRLQHAFAAPPTTTMSTAPPHRLHAAAGQRTPKTTSNASNQQLDLLFDATCLFVTPTYLRRQMSRVYDGFESVQGGLFHSPNLTLKEKAIEVVYPFHFKSYTRKRKYFALVSLQYLVLVFWFWFLLCCNILHYSLFCLTG